MTQAQTARPPLPATEDDRPMKQAIWRGFRRRCPNCGNGHLFTGYLKVADVCPACHEDLHHHRADDGPAYLTILIVGHLMAPLLLLVYQAYRPAPIVTIAIFVTGTVALSLLLLPRLKGVIVAIQWSRRMHGFGKGD